MEARASAAPPRRGWDWAVVGEQELRDHWLGGRGLVLSLAFSLVLSIIAYLGATNQSLNFLEQREVVSLMVQVAIGVGTLLALLAGGDAVSGERERGTLESLLLTPASRLSITAGKLLGALSLWVAAFLVMTPYVWFLGRGVGLIDEALLVGFVVGTLLAVFLASLGYIVSVFSGSNRVSLSLSLFILLALFMPTQLPAGAQKGWAGDLLLKVNPITAGERFVGKILVDGHSWGEDFKWLVSPIVGAVVFAAVAVVVGARYMRLRRTTVG
jgi:ABC-2 type transport system permease protein